MNRAITDQAEVLRFIDTAMARPILRPEVAVFALQMERKLRENDHKPGWKKDSGRDLYQRLLEEVDELGVALRRGACAAAADAVRSEAADVANFAMMIADVCGGLMRDISVDITTQDPRWAIVHVLGHETYAGRVDEVDLCGTRVLRVTMPAFDVPAASDWRGVRPAYTVPEWSVHMPVHSLHRLEYVTEAVARDRVYRNHRIPTGWMVPCVEPVPGPTVGQKVLFEGDESPVEIIRVDGQRIYVDDCARPAALWLDATRWPSADMVEAIYSADGELLWGGSRVDLPF